MFISFTLIELIYTLLLVIPSLFIYFKTKELYNFSKYKSLKYFSNAFLFFAIAFFVRFIYFSLSFYSNLKISQIILFENYLLILFEFLFLLPGFYFLMSLLYKHIVKFKSSYRYTIWCSSFLFFILISLMDYLWHTFLLMYVVSIIIFFFNSLISYRNYLKKKTLYGQIFSISMILLLISWSLNFATQNLLQQLPIIRYYVYLINIAAVIIILYIVNKLTKDF